MSERAAHTTSSRWLVVAAFAAIYLIWGSAYLAIRFAIETVPPLLMAGLRFLFAGGLLYIGLRLRGAERPTATNWRAAATVGILLVCGNGAVTWAEQWLPSGLAALLIATVPLWMVLLAWARGGDRPTVTTAAGLGLGLVGIVLLIGPGSLLHGSRVDPVGALAVLLGAVSWAAGSVYARTAPMPAAPLVATAMEILAGGALLTAVGLAAGDGAHLHLQALSLRSVLAFGFLVIFGSIVAFTAYLWLLRATSPARASTYAYVNPVVAVFLGWLLADEPVSPLTAVAAAFIIAAVAIIVMDQVRSRAPAAPQAQTVRGPLPPASDARPRDQTKPAR